MTEVFTLMGHIAEHDPAIVAVILVVFFFLMSNYLQGRDQKEDRKATREVLTELNVTLRENNIERGASRVQGEQVQEALWALNKDRQDLTSIAGESTAALKECVSALRESTETIRDCRQELRDARDARELQCQHAAALFEQHGKAAAT